MKKILVADAEEAFRHEARGYLQHSGPFVECADNAPDAIRMGLALKPDVLLTGLKLAGKTSGVDVARSLAGQLGGLRVVFIINPAEREELETKLGDFEVADVLTKPVSPTALRERGAGLDES
jgi:CheY-like chemotaxis protein